MAKTSNSRANLKSPAFEKAVASALKARFADLDIYQDDFGHANWGVYIQLKGDSHAGAYALLSQLDENWGMGVYTTDHDDGIYFIDFPQLPSTYEGSGGKGKAPSVAKIADAVEPHIKEALKYEFNYVRPLSADLAKALESSVDKRGIRTFAHIPAYDKNPSGVFAMLDGTHNLMVWLEDSKWRAEVQDINHKDWKGAALGMDSLTREDLMAEVAAQVKVTYDGVKEHLQEVLAGWPAYLNHMQELGLDPLSGEPLVAEQAF